MTTYRTRSNDVLDDICYRHYGRTTGTVEAVMIANPGLADQGPMLPSGLLITLPELPEAQASTTTIHLWD